MTKVEALIQVTNEILKLVEVLAARQRDFGIDRHASRVRGFMRNLEDAGDDEEKLASFHCRYIRRDH